MGDLVVVKKSYKSGKIRFIVGYEVPKGTLEPYGTGLYNTITSVDWSNSTVKPVSNLEHSTLGQAMDEIQDLLSPDEVISEEIVDLKLIK